MSLFWKRTLDLEYESSSGEDQKEEGTHILTEATLKGTSKSVLAS